MKLCKTDKSTLITYGVISAVAIGISCVGFAFNTVFNYYPLVITAISFVCGFLYLAALLHSSRLKKEVNEGNKSMIFASQMGSNFLRFAIMVIGVLCCFLFVHFTPVEGGVEKWVYALILIAGVPMIVDIVLFYLRSAYVE